jgi:hypothetical protein
VDAIYRPPSGSLLKGSSDEHTDHPAPIPRSGDRVGHRRARFGRGDRRPLDDVGFECVADDRRLRVRGEERVWPHGAQGDARLLDPAVTLLEGDRHRHDGRRVGLLAPELDEGGRARGRRHLDRDEQLVVGEVGDHEARVELGQREDALPAGASQPNPGIQREQRHCHVTAGRRGEQVPPDRGHVADRPARRLPGGVGQERHVVLCEELCEGHGRANGQDVVGPPHGVEARTPEAHHAFGQGDPLVDQRHRHGSAGHDEQVGPVLLKESDRLGQ